MHESLFLESAYSYFDEPDITVTVLLSFLACDGIEKRRAEHPYYRDAGADVFASQTVRLRIICIVYFYSNVYMYI